jgi:DNA processing protein
MTNDAATDDARLRLSFGGLHPDRLRSLVEQFGSAAAVVARIDAGALRMSDHVRAAVRVSAADRRAELDGLGHRVWFRGEPGYPSALAIFPDAPDVLFTRGRWPSGGRVGVVGTRRCTTYGRRLAGEYGAAIGAAGWVLVSGLARGIDGAAHEGTVRAGARGIAVLGCGLDVDYPREHSRLAAQLVDGGGVIVSEYPPGTPPEGWRFPPRNRIISGLSEAVVVVEASVKGGALITAGAAMLQGIPVFVTPGDVTREVSRGCNLLIRDGAHPVLDAEDLVAELELVLGPVQEIPVDTSEAHSSPVLGALVEHGQCSVDDLARQIDLAVPALLAELGVLEAAGLVEGNGLIYTARTGTPVEGR